MKVTNITRDDFYKKLDQPFNPPSISNEQDKNAFLAEWHAVRRQLLTVLEQFGENDDYDDKDFNLGEIALLSRGLGVTFTSNRMFRPQVIEAIACFLKTLPEAYEVNVMLQEDGVGQHALFISQSELLSDLPERLRKSVIPQQWLTKS